MRWLVPLLVLAWVSTAAWSDPAPDWSGGGIVWNDAVYKLNYAVNETTWEYKWWVTFNGYTVTDPGYFTAFVVYDPTTGLTYDSSWSSVTDVDNVPLNESWEPSSYIPNKVAIEWKKGSGAPNAGVGTIGSFGADFNRKIAWEDPVNIGTLMSAIHVQGLGDGGTQSLWIHSGNIDPRPPGPPDIVPEPSLGVLLLVTAVPLLGLWRRRRRV